MKFHKKIDPSYTETEILVRTYSESIYEEIMSMLDNSIYLKSTSGAYRVKLGNIIYIGSNRNYLEVYAKENNTIKNFRVRLTLYKIKELLSDDFIQISRTYIINYNFLDSVEADLIHGMVARVMGFKIPISRIYLEEIYSKLEEENN